MKLRVNVNGKNYEVEVEILDAGPQPGLADYGVPRPAVSTGSAAPIAVEKASRSPASAAPTPAGSNAEGSNLFSSPISGVVKRVAVAVGQAVKSNDELMVLEAMKMETALTSHSDGTVAQIHAQEGDSVQVGQTLVEFE